MPDRSVREAALVAMANGVSAFGGFLPSHTGRRALDALASSVEVREGLTELLRQGVPCFRYPGEREVCYGEHATCDVAAVLDALGGTAARA